MRKVLGLTLGIMTALGGFVDLGQIVFTVQAGALFGYSLLWVVALGTIAIILYMEMCGRIAAVAQEPVFNIVPTHLGRKLGLAVLIASNLLNVITCAAEVAGVAIILRLLTGANEKLLLIAAGFVLGATIWLMRFQWIERTFGLSGLLMVVFALSAWRLRPDWNAVATGFLPNINHAGEGFALYAYFAVGIFSALLMAYEVHFYGSGGIEEDWTTKDLYENTVVATFGSVLGSVLTCALLILGALVFLPRKIFPDLLSSTAMPGSIAFGPRALVIALLGMLACIAGAAVETALSGGYNVCQFYHWQWGKNLKAREAPRFTIAWVLMLVIAVVLALTGIKPLQLVNYSIIFGMVVLPFTYYPILKVAGDRKILHQHANGRVHHAIGWLFFVLMVIAAVAAIPLMLVTHFGTPN